MDHKPNPYRDATAPQLHRLCSEVIRELEIARTRTPEERRELAERTRHLLLVLASRLHEPVMPGSPEKRLASSVNKGLVGEFMQFNALLAREALCAARTETIVRAAAYVLGRGAWAWLNFQLEYPDGPAKPWGRQVQYVASQGDENLADALAALHALVADPMKCSG